MKSPTKISNSGVWLLLGSLALASAESAACSSQFHSCEELRTCASDMEGGAGAAGDESTGASGKKNRGSGGSSVGAAGDGEAGEVLFESGANEGGMSGQGGADTSGMSGEGGASANGMSSEGGAAGADCGEACACDGHACDCKVAEQRSCAAAGLLGSCAAGTQTCGTDRHWGACSIQAKSKDTCAVSNDDTCNGVVNEGCPCVQGQQRPCSDGGFVGKCATGKQTCGADATWGACSIAPAASDSCQPNNNDNCSGPANEGCLCIEGVTTRPCGACQDGTQTCTNGATGQFGVCVGGTAMTTYYLDADGDGHATNVSTSTCGAPPAHYITGPVDDCYDGNADAFPGQTNWFMVNRGDGSFDYNCSNGEEPLFKKGEPGGCMACNAACDCATPEIMTATPACGTTFDNHDCFNNPVCEVHSGFDYQYCR